MKYYVVHGIRDCPSCLRAQALLMEKDLEYTVMISDFSPAYRNQIRRQLNWTTFPIIVEVDEHNNSVIGGYEQLEEHLKGNSSP